MPKFNGFVGPAFEARAGAADYERLVNLYPEKNGPNAADPWVLYSTPGLAAFATLPTSPVRGTWVGEGRLFAVAGSHFYEVFADSTYTDRGDVGDDGLPVQIFPNGPQVMIISAGNVYVDTGTELVQPVYTSAQGTVNTSGTDVSLVWGDYFDDSMALNGILINGGLYIVASVTDPFNLVLFTSATTQTGVPYSVPISGTVATNGTAVTYNSGDLFDWTMTGHGIYIAGTRYTVERVTSTNTLVLKGGTEGDPGVHGAGSGDPVPYWILPPVTASCGAFLDGYFIVATPNTKQFNISALYNGLRWDPIDYAIKEGYPDNIAQMLADHEELYLFGTTHSSEVWRNTGNADFPFERDAGAVMHINCGAKWSVATSPDGVIWLEGDDRGGPVCYIAKGYAPQRVSTHALEYRWKNYTTWTDAEGFAYEDDGHWFYQVSFPAANETWVYDVGAGAWHQRASGTVPASLTRHRARCHAYVWGQNLVGDYSSGAIYRLSSEYTNDAGAPILRLRRAPHLTDDLKRSFYSQFILALAAGAFSSLTLRWSDDYGVSWSTPRVPDGARIASGVAARILAQRWNRLGSSRDRLFEVAMVATSKVAWISAEVEAIPGN